jgi:LCP family protein required for cell wall assembly
MMAILSALAAALIGLVSYAGVLIYKASNNPSSLFDSSQANKLTTLAPDTTAAHVPDYEEFIEVEAGVKATTVPTELRDANFFNGYEYNKSVITVVLVGIDVLSGRGDFGFRADTIILGAIDSDTGKATLLSIPRDTYTLVQRIDSGGNIVSYEMNRINAAFAFGHGRYKYSYQNTLEALSYLLCGIPLEYYVGFDMDGMVGIVDCVGGVQVDVAGDVAEAAEIPSGSYRLNGEQALAYVRARKTTGGDPARIKRQQEFVLSFLSDIKKHNPVSYVPQVYEAVKHHMNTNLTAEQIAALALLLKDLDLADVATVTLAGKSASIGGMSVWQYDEQALMETVRNIFFIQKS